MRVAVRVLRRATACCAASVMLLSGSVVQAAQSPAPEPTIVLDTRGSWRLYHTLKPPVVRIGGELKPVMMTQPWLNWDSPAPPPGWAEPDFDDSRWLRDPAGKACKTSYLSRLCMRGRFRITDPVKLAGLTLSVQYHGGVIVRVNGSEIARADLSQPQGGADALARAYPAEAFVTAGGTLLVKQGYYLPGRKKAGRPTEDDLRRMALRVRSIDVAIARQVLRAGVNVVAIEVIRAPYHEVLHKMRRVSGRPSRNSLRSEYDLTWNTCQIVQVRLTTNGPAGLVPNATRPEGLQAWNSNPLAADYDMDWGDPCEPLRPARLVGARNGLFSGKLVLGSTRPIRDLQVVPGELRGPAGAIPAAAVRIRYGLPWGHQQGIGGLHGNPYPREAVFLEAIADEPLPEFAVPEKRVWTHEGSIRPIPVLGPVVPVWVTVEVPADAAPGLYKGELTIRAQGEPALEAAVQIDVANWRLPSPQDYRTWVDMIQSPDTLAVEYDLDPWSDRHWELIARSFDLMGEVGNKTLYVPLIAHTNLGNAESMVRWVEKDNDEFAYDFSILEKYLDLAEKHMGKPRLIVLNVWDVYLIPKEDGKTDAEARRAGERVRHVRMAKNLEARKGFYGVGPLVTLLEPAKGNVENVFLPRYEQEPSKRAWSRLFAELRRRMAERGLEQALVLGMLNDAWPSVSDTRFFKDVAPGVPWMIHSHDGFPSGKQLHALTPVIYQARVWGVRFADATPYKYTPVEGRMYGWQRPERHAVFERFPNTDSFPATKWRHTGEYIITGDQRGIGRLGADFWFCVADSRGRRRGRAPSRYPEAHWRNLNVCTSLLAPGPTGPASTNRFEHFREGIQECEARITVERALTDDALRARLGPDLAERCQDALDERLLYMWRGLSSLQLNGREFGYATAWRWTAGVDGHIWFIGSGWRARTLKLFELAGEVSRCLEGETE